MKLSRIASEFNTIKGETVRIGDVIYSLETEQLQRPDGKTVELRNQSSQVLAYLAARPGEVISKDELFQKIWGEAFVTDDSLVQCISEIRRAVGDKSHRVIQTLPKKGYRLNVVIAQRDTSIGSPPSSPRSMLILVAVIALVTAATLGWSYWGQNDVGLDLVEDRPRIAVLSFDDFSAGDDKGYFSDAIAEGIITELARSRTFAVISRNSSFSYRGADKDLRQIGEELGVHYILEGSQQKVGDNIRVTVQLVDAKSSEHIWAHTYDQKVGDLFVVQDKIIRTVADRIGQKIVRPLPVTDVDRATALHYNLMGRAAIKSEFSAENNAILFEMNRKAIEVDPDSQFGYRGLANAYRNAATFGWQGLSEDEAVEKGLENGLKALSLAPDDPEVHYVLARLYHEAGETEISMARFSKAIEMNPSASQFLVASTSPMLMRGHTDEAIKRIEQAMGIDPFHPDSYHWQLAWALWEKEQCEAALASMQRMNLISKGSHRMLAGIYACLGDVENAQKAFQVFYADSEAVTISEQREIWKDDWTAPGSLDRFLEHMKIAGMKE